GARWAEVPVPLRKRGLAPRSAEEPVPLSGATEVRRGACPPFRSHRGPPRCPPRSLSPFPEPPRCAEEPVPLSGATEVRRGACPWDRSGIQRRFRSSGERHPQLLFPLSFPT